MTKYHPSIQAIFSTQKLLLVLILTCSVVIGEGVKVIEVLSSDEVVLAFDFAEENKSEKEGEKDNSETEQEIELDKIMSDFMGASSDIYKSNLSTFKVCNNIPDSYSDIISPPPEVI